MAWIRLSPGIWRDSVTGKTVRSATQPGANAGNTPNRNRSNIPNPLGTTINKNMPQSSQDVLAGGTELTKTAQQLAQEQLGNTKQFDPNSEDSRRYEDAIFGRLTQYNDRNKQREQDQLEQTLYNRGISLNPADKQYNQHMGALNERYDALNADARAQATQMGLDANLNTRKQQMSDLDQLANKTGLGTSGADFDLAYKKFLEEQRANKATEAILKKKNTGGGGTTTTTAPVFNDTTAPGVA